MSRNCCAGTQQPWKATKQQKTRTWRSQSDLLFLADATMLAENTRASLENVMHGFTPPQSEPREKTPPYHAMLRLWCASQVPIAGHVI